MTNTDTAIQLDRYIAARAEVEGVEYGLNPHFFDSLLMNGSGCFFGVEVVDGELVSDSQEPYEGFLDEFKEVLETV